MNIYPTHYEDQPEDQTIVHSNDETYKFPSERNDENIDYEFGFGESQL